ncbi:MAG: LytTR family DNA-binding domain-containing protein, partial [Bacteroidota bacterium]
MMLKALIIDDEFLARRKVESLLKPYPYVKVIGEARNGAEAVNLIHLKSPDLIFLDVQMPDFGGFDVIQKLNPNQALPYIIFTTAYDQYAVQAFEVQAIDYLLKPLEAERFRAALEKARQQLHLEQSEATNAQILQMLKSLNQEENDYRSRFEIKEKGRLIQVQVEDIYCLAAQGNYIELITAEKKYLYRSTMQALENEMDKKEFIRIHRSYLLNIRYIQSCRYLNNHEYRFGLKNGQEIVSGRAYYTQIQDYLAQN